RVTSVNEHPSALAAGDFNEDGRVDWVYTDAPVLGICRVTIWVTGLPSRSFGQCLIDRADLKIGDFNNDGHLDVVVAYPTISGNNGLAVLLGDGRGGLGPPRTFPVGRYPRSVTVGDFNNDGNLDLVVAGSGIMDIYMLLGDGTGDFTVRPLDIPSYLSFLT